MIVPILPKTEEHLYILVFVGVSYKQPEGLGVSFSGRHGLHRSNLHPGFDPPGGLDPMDAPAFLEVFTLLAVFTLLEV